MLARLNVRAIVLFALAVILVTVRVWHLDATCLWFDEIYSVQAAEQPWGNMLSFIALDLVHPPLFYILLKVWIAVGGESIFWLRLLPVVFSVLTIGPFMLFAREVKAPQWAVPFGLFLIAVNGTMIKYSQELRMYTMLMFVSSLSIWLFARYFVRGKSWLALVLVNILLIYTHYYGWLVVVAEVLAILMYQRMKWRRIAVMAGIVLAAFTPWLVAIVRSAAAGSDLAQNIEWIERPGGRELLRYAIDLVEPFYFQASSADPSSVFSVSIPLLLIILLAIVLSFAAGKPANGDEIKLTSHFVTVPLCIAIIASWLLPYSVWGTRHLIIIIVPLAILVGRSIYDLPVAWVRTSVIALVILFSGYGAILEIRRPVAEYVWCGWAGMAEQADPTKPIYTSETLAAYHSWFATRHERDRRISIIKVDNVEDKTYFIPRGFAGLRQAEITDVVESDVFLLYRTEPPNVDPRLADEITKRGYSPCSTRTAEYGRSTIFLVEMTRSGCGR